MEYPDWKFNNLDEFPASKKVAVKGDSVEVSVPFEKVYDCYECEDTGEVMDMQYDNDSHNYYDDGSTKPCICTL